MLAIRYSWLHALPWFALLLSLVGCGRAIRLVPVEGVAKLDGKPLAGAAVFFLPEGMTGQTAYGEVRADGSFRLATLGRDGATPAKFKVIVGVVALERSSGNLVKQEKMARQNRKAPMSVGGLTIPPEYSDASTTPLRCTVPVAGKLVLELHATGR